MAFTGGAVKVPPYAAALPPIEHEGRQMVDARSLHGWLGNKDRFATWIKDRLSQYGFVDPDDFVCVGNSRSKGQRGGSNRKDYLLTLDMAKELAMVERTDIGRETRRS